MKQKKVLLLGSYGQSNLGDDLLMWNYLELLRSRGFEKIYVNANTTEFIPDAVKEAYPRLEVLNTYKTSLLQYIRLIRQVDCVVYGGGTLYKELYASTGRSPYSVIMRLMGFNMLARLLGTKVYHLHIGIGSLKTWRGKWITKRALNAASRTIFRDEQSFAFAKDTLGVSTTKIQKSTDGLFINHIWEKPWRSAKIRIDRKKYKRVVGVNLLSDIPDWVDRDHYIGVVRQFVKSILDKGDFVVFMPFQSAFNPRNDLVFMKETFGTILKGRKNFTMLDGIPIDQVHAYIAQCDVFVGARFHSLLLSTAASRPFVAVAYDTKCWRFVEETKYPYAIKLESLEHDKLIKLYEAAYKNREKLHKRLEKIKQELYKEAEEGLRTLNL